MPLLALPDDTTREGWLRFVQEYISRSQGSRYSQTHAVRYAETVHWLPRAPKRGARALEVGATTLFQELLRHLLGYDEVHGTDFETASSEKSYFREISNLSTEKTWYMTHRVNIEDEGWPFADGHFDLVMLCEVIEHMEVDPMHVLSEINRSLSPGGRLLLSTPNSTSSRILLSILNGYRPHFYMQYNKTRELYRHNFEHDVHSVTAMLNGAGFEIERLATIDCFNASVPEVLRDLEAIGRSTANRGDNIFALARKRGPVVNRYPAEVYS